MYLVQFGKIKFCYFLLAVQILKKSYKSRRRVIEETISVPHTVQIFCGSVAVKNIQVTRLQRERANILKSDSVVDYNNMKVIVCSLNQSHRKVLGV